MKNQVLQNKNYRKILAANAINGLGDNIDSIAFTWLTYTMTESASLSALVFTANMLPTVIFQPLAAPIVDKLKKQPVMVCTDFLRAVCLAGFIALLCNHLLQPWMFVAFTFLINTIEAFRIPAGVAFLPKFLAGEELNEGIRFNQMASRTCALAGMALGGVLATVSPLLAMAIDLLTFVLSGLLIARMQINEIISEEVQKNDYWTNLKDGVFYLGKNRMFRVFVITVLLTNMLGSVFGSVSTAYVSGVLHASANYISSANMLIMICSLAMLWLYPKIAGRLRVSTIFTWTNFGTVGILYLILAFLPVWNYAGRGIIWCILFLMMGIAQGLFGAYVNILFVKVVDEAYLSRAAGVFNSAATLAMPFVSTLIAGLVRIIEVPVVLAGAGVISLLVLLVFRMKKSCNILDGMI